MQYSINRYNNNINNNNYKNNNKKNINNNHNSSPSSTSGFDITSRTRGSGAHCLSVHFRGQGTNTLPQQSSPQHGTTNVNATSVTTTTTNATTTIGSPLPPRYRFRELLLMGDTYNTLTDDGER